MHFPRLVPGHFLRRNNRFRATVTVGGITVSAHLPNSGHLTDLLIPHHPVWLAPTNERRRKTAYDLILIELAIGLVSVDAGLPGRLFAEAVVAGHLPDFTYPTIVPEVVVGDSRLDFRLSGPEGVCWVETKSVTLVADGVALFPDVPTERGRRHLHTLLAQHQAGARAAIVFVIQRVDAGCLQPHPTTDPKFAAALRQVVAAGVEARAFTCRVSLEAITLAAEVPVVLTG
jgi:sugar fermentation stimulation protein A